MEAKNKVVQYLLIICTFFLIAFLSASGQAATYYIDGTHGNDNNSGTLASPWKSINKANSTLQPSDTVYIRLGTYTSDSISPNNSGTSDDSRITYQAYHGEYPVIFGANTQIDLNDVSYITIKGITFQRPNSRWAHISNTDHVTIDSCIFEDAHEDMAYYMILVENSSYFQFLKNSTNTEGVPEESNSQNDLFTLKYVVHSLILNNYFGDASHNAFGIEAGNSHPEYNVIKGNIFTNKYRHALAINRPNLDFFLVEGNTFIRVGRDRDRNPWHNSRKTNDLALALKIASENCIYRLNILYGCDSPVMFRTFANTPNKNNWFYHNTNYNADGNDVYDSKYGGSLWYGESPDPEQNISNNHILNNINWKAEDDRLVNVYPYGSGMIPTGNIIAYNIIGDPTQSKLIRWGNDIGDIKSMEVKNSQWVEGTNLSLDPLFVNSDGKIPDFTLKPASPAIDAGTYITKTNGSAIKPSSSLICDEVGWAFSGPFPPWLIDHPEVSADRIYFKQQDDTWVEREIRGIDYTMKTIKLDSPATWENNTPVYFRKFQGTAPDIGAYEYQSSSTTITSPINLKIVVH